MSLIVLMLMGAGAARAEVILGIEVPEYGTAVQFLQDEMYEVGYNVGVIYPYAQTVETIDRTELCGGPFAVGERTRANVLTLEFEAHPRGLNKLVQQLKGESEWICRAVVLDGKMIRGEVQCRGRHDDRETSELKTKPLAKPTCAS